MIPMRDLSPLSGAGACDAHFHVFGPAEQYPYVTDLRYKPPYEPLEAFLKLARRIGFERFVFVQPSAYGFDNSCMFDAMAETRSGDTPRHCHLDETNVKDNELADAMRWACAACGSTFHRSGSRRLDWPMKSGIVRMAKICRELGWHLDLLLPGWLIGELCRRCANCRSSSRSRTWGYSLQNGAKQKGFQEFLTLVNDGSKRCWVKLTGIYRFSQDPRSTM